MGEVPEQVLVLLSCSELGIEWGEGEGEKAHLRHGDTRERHLNLRLLEAVAGVVVEEEHSQSVEHLPTKEAARRRNQRSRRFHARAFRDGDRRRNSLQASLSSSSSTSFSPC